MPILVAFPSAVDKALDAQLKFVRGQRADTVPGEVAQGRYTTAPYAMMIMIG